MFLIEHALNLQDMLVQKGKARERQQMHPVFIYNNDDEVFYILEINGYLICVIYQKARYISLNVCNRSINAVAFNSEK